jgi:hypothetical protein
MTYWNHISFTVALSFAALSPPLHAQTADNTIVVGQSLPLGVAGVAPKVNIAALKKLFSDPHYSVVDGLDTDMADFSQDAPLPLSMLRQMTSAKTVNMFKDDVPFPFAANSFVPLIAEY